VMARRQTLASRVRRLFVLERYLRNRCSALSGQSFSRVTLFQLACASAGSLALKNSNLRESSSGLPFDDAAYSQLSSSRYIGAVPQRSSGMAVGYPSDAWPDHNARKTSRNDASLEFAGL
jgi:hypothetical protein